MAGVTVAVEGVPAWVPVEALLGPGGWRASGSAWVAELDRDDAADVAARLRGVSLGGRALAVRITPALSRQVVRAGRLRDARARRDTTPGFTRAGARLDDEGRMSLTPEALALAIGRRAGGRSVVDATCGCGGNAIGFARAGCRVVAIDVDPARLAMARHNAALYGVADRITLLAGAAAEVLPALPPPDLVFVDPPWGADWDRARTDLGSLPVLGPILAVCAGEVWVKAPPSFDPGAMPGATAEAWFGAAAGDRHRVKFVLVRLLQPG